MPHELDAAHPHQLPLDPDTDANRLLPDVHWPTAFAVFAGAFFGGIARYGIGKAWPTPAGEFPWATLAINTVGTLVLAVVVVTAAELLPSRTYLRPTLGTGFCGAFTTFSSVATAADLLGAHGHAATAAGYLAISILTGLAAALFGLVIARRIGARWC